MPTFSLFLALVAILNGQSGVYGYLSQLETMAENIKTPPPPQGYGKYKIIISAIEFCHGPKKKNSTLMSNMAVGNGKNSFFKADAEVLFDVGPLNGGFINYGFTKNNRPKVLHNLHLSKGCNDLSLKFMLAVFNMTDECIVKKGRYHFHARPNEISHMVQGDEVYYERHGVKLLVHSRAFNFICILAISDTVPLA